MAGNINELTQEQLKEEYIKTKCLLFIAVRNTTVLPKGLLLGKSEKEICDMTLATIQEMAEQADFDTLKKILAEAEQWQEV